MGYELREHTADVAVAATGDTLEEVFAAVADGLAAASCEDAPPVGERFSLSVEAEGLEALLFDYLDELVYLRDVREELPVDNEVTIERGDGGGEVGRDGEADEADGAGTDDEGDPSEEDEESDRNTEDDLGDRWSLEGSARGVPLSAIDAREVKAVTYSEMRLEEGPEGWEAYVVFDV